MYAADSWIAAGLSQLPYPNPHAEAGAASESSWYQASAGQSQSQSLLPQLDGPAGAGRSPGPGPGSGPQVDGTGTNFIGVPVHFTEGRFAGETICAELEEIQRPEYGRRFGSVDRRVLDDPPVVALRLYRVHNAETSEAYMIEIEDYENIALAGLVCMVDLFEIRETSPTMGVAVGLPVGP
ncbi:hypothetical protein C8F01DRAFT_1371397, partial [Mycena amicta]